MINSAFRKASLYGLSFLLALIALAFLFNSLRGTETASVSTDAAPELKREDGKIIVPAERVPDNFQDRTTAPVLSLLPGHVDVYNEPVPIASKENNSLKRAVEQFLAKWETFNPKTIGRAESLGRPNPYLLGLQPYVDNDALDKIANREDSIDPTGVCPRCLLGSRWLASDISGTLKVEDYDGQQAYVTVTGLVQYVGDQQFDSLVGSIFYRSYALLLQKQGNGWVVNRAIAETLEPVQL